MCLLLNFLSIQKKNSSESFLNPSNVKKNNKKFTAGIFLVFNNEFYALKDLNGIKNVSKNYDQEKLQIFCGGTRKKTHEFA